MIKSKYDDYAISFIMGVSSNIELELDKLGATYEIEEGKYYLAKLPKDKLSEYEDIIISYLRPGFWNEYISDEVVFIFKTIDNEVLKYVLNDDTELTILSLCNEYAGFNKTSVSEMILAEPFYQNNISECI